MGPGEPLLRTVQCLETDLTYLAKVTIAVTEVATLLDEVLDMVDVMPLPPPPPPPQA